MQEEIDKQIEEARIDHQKLNIQASLMDVKRKLLELDKNKLQLIRKQQELQCSLDQLSYNGD
jgi:hypothetical protein